MKEKSTFLSVRFLHGKSVLNSDDCRKSGLRQDVLQLRRDVSVNEPDGAVRKQLGPELDDVVIVAVNVPLPLHEEVRSCQDAEALS